MKQEEYVVYVQDKDGNPLMPTKRFGWVRRALDSGRAVPVTTVPFTIRLTYETETHVTQPIAVGIDPGRTNIGTGAVREDGTVLHRAKCETRNKAIPKLMAERRQHRQARRRGERLARKRLAKRLGTTVKQLMKRKLPGYGDGVLTVKDIINTEARFNNRKQKEGWLTPTATQLMRTHINLLKKTMKILPVTDVALELNKFDFVKMDNPDTYKSEYGNGPKKGYGSDRGAIVAMQDGKCLLCGRPKIDHIHHLVPKSKGGSESLANKAGLCLCCHQAVHTDKAKADELTKKKEGINKKYHALSVLNQIIPYLTNELAKMFPGHLYLTRGYDTKQFRDANGIEKDHDLDACCIAMAAFGFRPFNTATMPKCHEVKQYRRHDRQIVKAQVTRSYYLCGKNEKPGKSNKVAQNRHPATQILSDGKVKKSDDQKLPALDEWFAEQAGKFGEDKAMHMLTNLTAKKSYRRRNELGRMLPGAIFIYDGKRYIFSGRSNGGDYFRAVGCGQKNFKPKECKVVAKNTGLVYLN